MNKRALVIGAAGFVLAFSGHAAAAPASAGEFQISLPSNVARISYYGEALAGSASMFSVRLGGYGPWVAFGYALTDQWLLGVEGGYSVSKDEGRRAVEEWDLGPRVTYVLRPGEPVRPFFGAGVTVEGRSWEGYDAEGVGGLVQAGTMIELVEGLSIDPGVGLDYSFRHLVQRMQADDDDRQMHSATLSASVALTAWL